MKPIDFLGPLLSIESLQGTCECGRRADFRITRSNTDLPKPYSTWGNRYIYVCAACFQQDTEATNIWNQQKEI